MTFGKAVLITVLVGISLSCPVLAQEVNLEELQKTISSEQLAALERASQDRLAVDRLWFKHVLDDDQKAKAYQAIDAEILAVAGCTLTTEQIQRLLTHAKEGPSSNIFTFFNIVRVVAALMLIVAFCWLFGHYLAEMPKELWEVVLWVAVIFGLLSKHLWPSTGMWIVLPAAFGLFGVCSFSLALHGEQLFGRDSKRGPWALISLVCCIVWGITSIQYASPVIGFMSILALEAFLGFSVLVTPLCYCIGFKDDASVSRATMASFIILAVYVVMHIQGTPAGVWTNFTTGALFMGAFVYYLGLLILSSKWYRPTEHFNTGHYMAMQALTIVSGMAALYLGSTFQLSTLLGIGGTFFFLYLLEKYLEIPWKDIGWAWALLGLSAGLYGAAMFAWSHPQYFLF